jgi:hypothetical protein
VLVVNEAAARRFFEGRDPLGQQIAFWGARRTVVAVVGNEEFQGSSRAGPSPMSARAPCPAADPYS